MRQQGIEGNYIMRSLITCTPHTILFGDQIEKKKMGWACSTYEESRYVYKILVGNPEGKRLFGKHWRRWKDNINMDLQEVESEGMDWIELTQDMERWRALVNAVMNLRVPQNEGIFLAC
jgi:hypothetical protein